MRVKLFRLLFQLTAVYIIVAITLRFFHGPLRSTRTTFSSGGHFIGGSRQDSIEKICEEMGLTSDRATNAYKRIIVNHRYNVLYCESPKVATTSWKRVFLILSGKLNASTALKLSQYDVQHGYKKYLTYLSDLQPEDIDTVMKTYYKFVFVREPFERLISAYRDKLSVAASGGIFSAFGRRIVRKYRKIAHDQGREKDPHPSFFEFLQYIVETKAEDLNEHWHLQEDLCQVCHIKYDLIGKYEELETATKIILEHIGAPSDVHLQASYPHEKSSSLLRHHYQDIPPSFLEGVWRKYYPDLQLFNYTVPSAIRNLITVWN
ncbi:carbohydrate sulfotransferase 14-like [Haliotis rufescens]|uniref:carbohydrate sulfotransferase 14-like n=1 Tax=Haliotis rufescens TaxID=6454 RepID=UPI00201EDADE|nr:carbohydrate sulfotransferase 14-like [Haliotis rufescens]